MIGRGVRVPCVWEHQPGADPIELSRGDKLANYVKHSFGEIRDARVYGKGVLWLEHEIYDPADAATPQLKRLQVSPKLYPGFSDSRGGEYRGAVVGHVAATPSPVQFWQKPFELSQGTALFLSYGNVGPDMAKELDEEMPEEVETPEVEPEETPVGGRSAELAALVDALREYGINIPDECEDLKHVIIAIKAAKGGQGAVDGMPASAGDQQTAPSAGPPMMMSDRRAVASHQKAQRKCMVADVKALYATGRIGRQKKLELERKIAAVELSFYEDGELTPNKLAVELEVLAALPANTAWKANGQTAIELSNTELEPHPESMTRGGPSKTEAEVVEETKRRARAYNPAAK